MRTNQFLSCRDPAIQNRSTRLRTKVRVHHRHKTITDVPNLKAATPRKHPTPLWRTSQQKHAPTSTWHMMAQYTRHTWSWRQRRAISAPLHKPSSSHQTAVQATHEQCGRSAERNVNGLSNIQKSTTKGGQRKTNVRNLQTASNVPLGPGRPRNSGNVRRTNQLTCARHTSALSNTLRNWAETNCLMAANCNCAEESLLPIALSHCRC